MKHYTKYMPEAESNDEIFIGKESNNQSILRNDTEYQKPAIKIWYYTNVDREIWLDYQGIPTVIPYVRKMFPNTVYRKGVYIVTTYDIRKESKKNLYAINNIISNNNLDLSHSDKQMIIEFCNRAMSKTYVGENLSIRLVNFVPIEHIEGNDVIMSSGFAISKDIDCLYDETLKQQHMTEKCIHKEGSFTLSVTYVSKNPTPRSFHIGKNEIKITPTKGYGKDHMSVVLNEVMSGKKHYLREDIEVVDAYGLIQGVTSAQERINSSEKVINNASKFADAKIKSMSERLKLMADVEVSYHKLLAFAINNKTAELKLDKENTSLFRELLKTVGGLM